MKAEKGNQMKNAVTTAIPGCKDAAQVRANAEATILDIGQAAHPERAD